MRDRVTGSPGGLILTLVTHSQIGHIMHNGTIETWIQARAALKRGRGMAPRHAAPGRHAAAPGRARYAVLKRTGGSFFGWTAGSVDHAARIGA